MLTSIPLVMSNTLLTTNQADFNKLEESRRTLIVSILEEQRVLAIQLEQVKSKIENNKMMLQSLADRAPLEPEGVELTGED